MATQQQSAVNAAMLGSIKTEILIAFVFSLLAMIVEAIMAAVYGGIALFLTPIAVAPMVAGSAAGFTFLSLFGIISMVMVVMFVLSLLSFLHINRMRNAADAGDVTTLKALNSVGWAIIALIFNGMIAGILLLVAHGSITGLK